MTKEYKNINVFFFLIFIFRLRAYFFISLIEISNILNSLGTYRTGNMFSVQKIL